MKCTTILGAVLAMALCGLSLPSAAWENDFQTNQLISDSGFTTLFETLVSDGAGGCYITWVDGRTNDGTYSVYGQRLDAQGRPQWADGGVLMMDPPAGITQVETCLGEDGSLWMTASVAVGSLYRIHVQNITPNGVRRFGTYGILATSGVALGQQDYPQILADGTGGAVVIWRDSRNNATTGTDIWAQRIALNGALLWGSAGTAVCQAAASQASPQLVLSEPGVMLCAWEDLRNSAASGQDIYGQRINADGSMGWTVNGVSLSTYSANQYLRDATTDGLKGMILAIEDYRNNAVSSADVYLVRCHPITGANWWTSGGVPVSTDAAFQQYPQLVPDGDGGAYVFWIDSRSDSYSGGSIYGQHIYGNGSPAWTADGSLMIYRDGSATLAARSAFMGDDGSIFLFAELNNLGVAQKISPSGSRLFGSAGVVIGSYSSFMEHSAACTDGRGGLIASWGDSRQGYYKTMYAQRVDRWGLGGAPEPELTTVMDRPNDQGGEVILSWDASALDSYADPYVDRYTAWMRLPDAPPLASVPEARVQDVAEKAGVSAETARSLLLTGWAYAGGMDAQRFASYALHAPSYGDSTAGGIPHTIYQILAHDDGYAAQWPSVEQSGWSVDNLAPGAPLALAAALDGVDVDLTWTPSGHLDQDLAQYHVHRSATPGFTPSPATFVGAATDTLYTDAAPPAGVQYYVVTAVDVHGNQGDPSNQVSVNSVTAVGDAPAVFALRGAVPNPFNPATAIRLDLPRDGRVLVEVFDARGARVRTLHDGPLPAGEQVLAWRGQDDAGRPLSSGVYFARATAGDAVSTVKLTLAR